MNVVEDLFSMENVARSAIAAGFAYFATPVLVQKDAPVSLAAVPGLSSLRVNKSTGMAIIAALTTTVVDLLQSRVLNRTKEGRLASYPSLALHIVGGGLIYSMMPTLLSTGRLGMSSGDTGKQLFMLGALSEIVSQYTYENYLNPGGEESWRF